MQKETDSLQRRRGKSRMVERSWRDRLAAAITKDGRSMRAISLAAGQNESYVWEMMNKRKEPTIGPLQMLCSVLGVSVSFILEGIEISPANERLLKIFSAKSPEQQEAFLRWLEAEQNR